MPDTHPNPNPSPKPGGGPPEGPPQTGPEVTIFVNNLEVRIHRGHQTVAAIKAAAGVPLAHELEQVVDGKLKPLPDDGAVTLKGGERFISHPRDASSS